MSIPKLGLYSDILYLGDIDGVPSVTFTAPVRTRATKPSESYLWQIARGLRTDYRMTKRDVAEYFGDKPGVREHYSAKQLIELQATAR